MSDKKFAVFNETTNADVSRHASSGEANEEADRLRRYHNAPHFQVRNVKDSDKEAKDHNNPTLTEAPGDGTLKDAPTADSLTQGAKDADEAFKAEQKRIKEAEEQRKKNEKK